MDNRALTQLIVRSGLSVGSQRILAESQPCVHIISTPAAEASLALGTSRIGGQPDAPVGFEWPVWKRSPLSFLAQLDLAELGHFAPGGVLPNSGYLYFFYSAELQPWGFDPKDRGGWRVLHSTASPHELRRQAPSSDLGVDLSFQPCSISLMSGLTLPPQDSIALARLELDESELQRYWEVLDATTEDAGDGAKHQFLGHPDPIQGDMQAEAQLASHGIYCGNASSYDHPRAAALRADAESWRLLLQLDSDENTGMMWGDSGRLYFWIQESALASLQFDKVWMILQCA